VLGSINYYDPAIPADAPVLELLLTDNDLLSRTRHFAKVRIFLITFLIISLLSDLFTIAVYRRHFPASSR
jgi:hypothetical protein